MTDISENQYKYSQEKHNKYLDFYNDLKNSNQQDKEYWGIGIENESYLMFENLQEVDKSFLQSNHKRERYSVDYWENYKKESLKEALDLLPDKVYLPIYLNGYLFQKTDFFGEPTKRYTKLAEPNPKFCGMTIDEYLKENSVIFNKLFDKQMIYDGDTFEFTTYNFYKTNVKDCVKELVDIKETFLN